MDGEARAFARRAAVVGSRQREAPALARIEYHRLLHRFFPVDRGAGRMAIVFFAQLLKSLLYVIAPVPGG